LIIRNFLTLGAGEVIARGMHVLAIILLARVLQPQTFGSFELAVAITSYAFLMVQQGFDTIAMREVSRDSSSARAWMRTVLSLRLAFASVMTAGIAAYAVANWQRPTSPLLVILCGCYFCNALSPRWLFLALEQSRPPAIAAAISQGIFLAITAAFVHAPQDAWRAALAWLAGDLTSTLILWHYLRAQYKCFPLRTHVSIWKLEKEAWPISVSMVLGQIMYNFDVLALGAFGKGGEIGLYLAAYRCATVTAPMLSHFQNSIFPRLARTHRDSGELSRYSRKIAMLAAAVGLAGAVALFFGATHVMRLLFGTQYVAGAPFLRILAWLLPVQFARAVLRQVLMAKHKQWMDTRNTALGAITNVAIDLALVPRWGALGCSLATVSSELVLLLASGEAVRRRLRENVP
jgi:polysaccharide transporter, PST family